MQAPPHGLVHVGGEQIQDAITNAEPSVHFSERDMMLWELEVLQAVNM